jgi:hypothetical protein
MATKTIGALSVEITADTSGVNKALKSTQKSVSKTSDKVEENSNTWRDWSDNTEKSTSKASKDVGDFSSKFASAFTKTALSLVAATTALTAYATVQGRAMRETEAMANIAGLSVEEFKRISFVMGTAGISAEKFGDIMKDTQERVGDFLATGGGPFQDFADVMGYTEEQALSLANEFEKMSGQEVLQEMVKRMEAAGKSTQRMSFALEGIASDTTRLIPLLQNGGAKAKELGSAFNEIKNPLTGKQQQDFKDLATNIDLATIAFTDMLNTAIAPLIPELTTLAQKFSSIFSGLAKHEAFQGFYSGASKVSDLKNVSDLDSLANSIAEEKRFLEFEINNPDFSNAEDVADKAFRLAQLEEEIKLRRLQIDLAKSFAKIESDFVEKDTSGKAKKPETDATAKQEEDNRRFLDSLKQRLMTQEELELSSHSKELKRVANIFASKTDLTGEQSEIEAAMLIEHQERMKMIRENDGQGLDDIRNRLKSQEEIAQEHYDKDLNLIREAYGLQNEVTAEQRELEAKLLQEHQDNLQEIKNNNIDENLDFDFAENLAMRFATEAEMEIAAHEAELERLQAHLAAKKVITEEDKTTMENMEKDHGNRMDKIKQSEQRAQIGIAAGTMGAIATAFQSGNEKMQKIGKKFAIARAVLAGGQAAVDAWRSGMETGGPWAPIVAAAYTAASLARTGSMISSIKGNSSPSKGGSVARPSVPSGSPGDSGGGNSNQQNTQNAERRVYINIEGDSDFSGNRLMKLIGSINDAVGEGVELISSNGA